MVIVLPTFEEEQPGIYHNTAVVVDADGGVLGKYRKNHIPNLDKVLGEVLFPAGESWISGLQSAVGPIGVYICYDRHFPEGWRELGLNGAQTVFNPNATRGLSPRQISVHWPASVG